LPSLIYPRKCLLNTATLRRRALPDSREASGLRALNHVVVLCVYRSGGVCQEGGCVGLYVARPRERSRRRHVHSMREEGKETTQESYTHYY
jgi:hypothetical protein